MGKGSRFANESTQHSASFRSLISDMVLARIGTNWPEKRKDYDRELPMA